MLGGCDAKIRHEYRWDTHFSYNIEILNLVSFRWVACVELSGYHIHRWVNFRECSPEVKMAAYSWTKGKEKPEVKTDVNDS